MLSIKIQNRSKNGEPMKTIIINMIKIKEVDLIKTEVSKVEEVLIIKNLVEMVM